MASGQSGAIVRQVQRLFGGGSVAGLREGQLLERFIKNRDESAFEAIIAHHGPMVLGVCRRVLHDPRDAEDAFQVTFLILVKKAGGIRDREQLGPWLHGVAQRVAMRARTVAVRRLDRERPGVEMEETAVDLLCEADRNDFRAVLDEELGRLPDKYRSPLVLCYLEGLTHEEAALRLRWPVGTVRSRMAWARDRLRGRLARRGLALPAAVLLSALASETTASPVPPALFESTLKAAMGLAVAKGATAGVVSASVASLMGEALNVMYYHKLKSFALGMLAVGAVTGGAVIANLESATVHGPARNNANPPPDAQAADADDDQLDRINKEIKQLEDRLRAAKQKRQAILAKVNGDQPDSAVTLNAGATLTTASSGAQGGVTITSGGSPGAPARTLSASSGGATTSVGSTPPSGVATGISVSTNGSASTTSASNGISIAASGSTRSPSRSSGMSITGNSATSPIGQSTGVGASGGGRGSSRGASQSSASGGGSAGSSSIQSGTATATSGSAPTRVGAGARAPIGGSGTSDGQGVGESAGGVNVFVTPDGKRVAVRTKGGATKVYSVPKGVRATPIVASSFVTLQLQGESIPEIALYDDSRDKWVIHKFREPVSGVISSAASSTVFAFQAGRQLGAYNSRSGDWELVEIPESTISNMMISHDLITVTTNKGIYILDPAKGKWEVTELNDEPADK
jgi:RNA polymerase sigma factor (sigma-70 family)